MVKITLTGNLSREPELTETSAGIKLCRFSIAANRKLASGENKADFYNISAWRGLGENVAKYCHKGSKVLVYGNVELNFYKDKLGNSRLSADVIAQDIEFLPSSRSNDGQTGGKGKASISPYGYGDDDDIPY